MPQPVILCVDDEKIILDCLEAQLQGKFGSDFTVGLAESGEEGLEIVEDCIAKQIEVPVILADYLMPGMKGDQFLIRIHQILPETNTILLTGQAGLDEVVDCINHANLYRYLAKPWELSDLILTVKEAIVNFQQQNIIKHQNVELQELNRNLEEQVAARTKELNRQKALFQQVFNNSPNGKIIFDAESKILEVNPAFEKILQFSLDEIKACSWHEVVVAPDWRDNSNRITNLALSGETVRQELQFVTKENKFIPVSLVAYPITTGTKEKAGIVVFSDLTEQREYEELLRRSYERRKRCNFFNELTAGISAVSPEAIIQAKNLGIDLNFSFSLMFLLIAPKQKPPEEEKAVNIQKLVDEIIDWLEQKPGVYSWDSKDGIGIIHAVSDESQDDEERKQLAHNLFKLLTKDYPGIGITLGIAEYYPKTDYFAERYQQARIAALIGEKLHPEVNIHHYWDIGAFPLITRLANDEESERFLERTIGRLVRYDKDRGTDLFPTLEKIISRESLRTVADEMFVHYKTVLFRKQSIEKILGVSLDSFEGRTLISTAMTLHYLREINYKL